MDEDTQTLSLFQPDTLANLSVYAGSEKAKKMTETSGMKLLELYKKPNPLGLFVKMLLVTSHWGSSKCFLTWEGQTIFHNVLLFRLLASTPRIKGKDSGLLHTPSGVSHNNMGRLDEWGGQRNPFRGTQLGKTRCATFEEWMMGYPIGWTDLKDCETQSSRK